MVCTINEPLTAPEALNKYGGGGLGGTQSILGYEVSCVLPVGTVPRRISQCAPPPVRTPPHASPAAMQAVLAAVMLP